MQASIEISLYPLTENYIPVIKGFIEQLNKKNKNLIIETNMMSTQIFGDYDELIDLLRNEIKTVLMNTKAVVVMKILGTNLKEKL